MRTILALLAASATIVLAPHAGIASKVGVAAAVNPDAYSGAGGARKELRIGKSIFYNERISTDASGVVQVLLVDGSTFTVGRNSDVVIDRFVYDPNKKTGEIVATFSKGSMRFIGGKISKNPDGVTVNTPDGSLAIRGGMFQGTVRPGGSIFSFLFGKELVFRGLSGKVYTVYQPGYTLDLRGGVPSIRPTTPADIQIVMASLTNSNVRPVSAATQSRLVVPQYLFALLSLQQLIIDATSTRIIDEILSQVFVELPTPPVPPPHDNMDPVDPVDPIQPINSSVGGYGSGLIFNSELYEYGFGTSTSPDDFSYNEETHVITMTLRDIEGGGYIQRGILTFKPTTAYNWNLSALKLFDYDGNTVDTVSSSGFLSQRMDNLCSSCDFIEWGTFGTEYSFIESGEFQYPVTEQIDLGWWVGGKVTAAQDLPQMGTASYAGTAIGSVISDGMNNPAVGRGDLGMTWNFAKRSGQFSISNFNANPVHNLPDLNVGGTMTMPGNLNQFSGEIGGAAGQMSVMGGARGSFVTDGKRPAAGVIGNWGVSSANGYRATGIFGGVSKP